MDYFRSTARSPIGTIARVNIASVRLLRDTPRNGPPPLADRVLVDWGGGFDSRHEKCTIVYRAATQELHAFVGGLDYAPDRLGVPGHHGALLGNYWHDLGVHLQGGAATAVMENFWTRWDETVTLPKRRYWQDGAARPFNPTAKPKPTTRPPGGGAPGHAGGLLRRRGGPDLAQLRRHCGSPRTFMTTSTSPGIRSSADRRRRGADGLVRCDPRREPVHLRGGPDAQSGAAFLAVWSHHRVLYPAILRSLRRRA